MHLHKSYEYEVMLCYVCNNLLCSHGCQHGNQMIGTSGHKTVTHQTGARLIDLKQANTAQHTFISFTRWDMFIQFK